VKSHTIQKQGGCAGMKQTCDAQMTEVKDDNCTYQKILDCEKMNGWMDGWNNELINDWINETINE
jgi:hypothetical protein